MIINLGDNFLNSCKVITVTENICRGATHWLGKENFTSLQIKFRIEHLKLEILLRTYRVSVIV